MSDGKTTKSQSAASEEKHALVTDKNGVFHLTQVAAEVNQIPMHFDAWHKIDQFIRGYRLDYSMLDEILTQKEQYVDKESNRTFYIPKACVKTYTKEDIQKMAGIAQFLESILTQYRQTMMGGGMGMMGGYGQQQMGGVYGPGMGGQFSTQNGYSAYGQQGMPGGMPYGQQGMPGGMPYGQQGMPGGAPQYMYQGPGQQPIGGSSFYNTNPGANSESNA